MPSLNKQVLNHLTQTVLTKDPRQRVQIYTITVSDIDVVTTNKQLCSVDNSLILFKSLLKNKNWFGFKK